LRASWLPKFTNGWFFRAESFFSVANYQDEVNLEDIPGVPPGTPPDFLSHSHGGGFLRFFEERCRKQGIFIFDEPEIRAFSLAPDRIPEADAQGRIIPVIARSSWPCIRLS
jgi:predicted ATPase